MLIGLFSPVFHAQAQELPGACWNISLGTQVSLPKSQCLGPVNEWRAGVSSGACWNISSGTQVPIVQSLCVGPVFEWRGANTAINTPATPPAPNTYYTPLAPLPGLENTVSLEGDNALGKYLNVILNLVIGIAAVLAMVMIVMGGIQYMTSELPHMKEGGKERITNAVFGLILALGSYLLLSTINPDLLKTDLSSLKDVTVEVKLEPETGVPTKTITLTKAGGGSTSLTACDDTQMENVSVFGTNVRVYKGVVSSLKKINTMWLAFPEAQRYKVNSISGYVCREVAGKQGYWSAHAFGLALDINPSTNPYNATLKTDMPSWFVQILKTDGWGWGGDWSNVKDPMHFSKYPPGERGDGVIDF